jgi:hypothetical protein
VKVTVWACERHPDRPAVHYDTYADEVLCGEHFAGEETAYEMEFVLAHVPADVPVHWPARPTVVIDDWAAIRTAQPSPEETR